MKLTKQALINLGVTLWVSFLSAGVATALFFATFDPSVLAQIATYPMYLGRTAGYSIGFLLFWVLLIVNTLVIIWLSTREPKS